MTCEQVETLLAGFLEGSLEAAAREQVSLHLESCRACGELRGLWQALGDVEPAAPEAAIEAAARAALKGRVDLLIQSFREGQRSALRERGRGEAPGLLARWAPHVERMLRPPASRGGQLGLAAASLAAGLLVGALVLGGRGSSAGELNALRREVHSTRQLVTVALLQQQSASDRLQGVSWSFRLRQPEPEVISALLGAVKYDTSDNVRLAAVDALVRLADRPEVRDGLVEAFGSQRSPLVQLALVDGYAQMADARGVEFLRKVGRDASLDPAVRQRAGLLLQQIGRGGAQ